MPISGGGSIVRSNYVRDDAMCRDAIHSLPFRSWPRQTMQSSSGELDLQRTSHQSPTGSPTPSALAPWRRQMSLLRTSEGLSRTLSRPPDVCSCLARSRSCEKSVAVAHFGGSASDLISCISAASRRVCFVSPRPLPEAKAPRRPSAISEPQESESECVRRLFPSVTKY